MNESSADDRRQPAPSELLLQVGILIEALARGLRAEAADESIFVFEAISEGRVGPGSFRVISLVFEAGAIDVVIFVIGKVEVAVERAHASGIAVQVQVVVAVEIIETGEAVLPAGRRGHGEFHAAEQAVELRPVAGIGRQGLDRTIDIY